MEETPKSLSFDDFSVKMRDKTPNYDVKINDKKELFDKPIAPQPFPVPEMNKKYEKALNRVHRLGKNAEGLKDRMEHYSELIGAGADTLNAHKKIMQTFTNDVERMNDELDKAADNMEQIQEMLEMPKIKAEFGYSRYAPKKRVYRRNKAVLKRKPKTKTKKRTVPKRRLCRSLGSSTAGMYGGYPFPLTRSNGTPMKGSTKPVTRDDWLYGVPLNPVRKARASGCWYGENPMSGYWVMPYV